MKNAYDLTIENGRLKNKIEVLEKTNADNCAGAVRDTSKLTEDLENIYAEKLIEQLKAHEGFSGNVYQCTGGKTTIGYGRNLDDNPLTDNEASYLLNNDVNKITDILSKEIPWNMINPARQAVLVNMSFNLGISGLYKFKKMFKAIDAGFYEKAAREMLDSKWSKQVGNRAIELSEQMRTGKWQK